MSHVEVLALEAGAGTIGGGRSPQRGQVKGSQQGHQVIRLGLIPHGWFPYKEGAFGQGDRLREGAVRTQAVHSPVTGLDRFSLPASVGTPWSGALGLRTVRVSVCWSCPGQVLCQVSPGKLREALSANTSKSSSISGSLLNSRDFQILLHHIHSSAVFFTFLLLC